MPDLSISANTAWQIAAHEAAAAKFQFMTWEITGTHPIIENINEEVEGHTFKIHLTP